MEQYDSSKHCCGSGSTAGTWSHPYPRIARCNWCGTWIEADKRGMFVLHPRSTEKLTSDKVVIPMPDYDPGYCSGCGEPLDAASAKDGYCPHCYQSMDDSPVTAALVWFARQFKHLVKRQRKLV